MGDGNDLDVGDGNELDVDVEEDVLIEEDDNECNEWTPGIIWFIPNTLSIFFRMSPILIYFNVIFKRFPGFTGNDVIIPGKLDISVGTSNQIICIGPRNNCANFHAFSKICTIQCIYCCTILLHYYAQ